VALDAILVYVFIDCITYADDLLLLSPSVNGMHCMLDICTSYARLHDLIFNASKSIIMPTGRVMTMQMPLLCTAKQPLQWTERC
jgi:hypothetical protein